MTMTRTRRRNLAGKGLMFKGLDTRLFRDAVSKSSCHADMKKVMGNDGWTLPEKHTGELA